MKKLWLALLSAALLAALCGLCAYAEETETPPLCETYEDAVLHVRQQLKNRETSFTFTYTGEEPIDIEDVLAYEGSAPDEGDYLRLNIKTYTQNAYEDGTVRCAASYLTTAAQEKDIGNTVEEIVRTLTEDISAEALTDYDKAKRIYDWVCNYITYFETGSLLGDYGAYHAMVSASHATTCLGYSLVFYRLAREMGLDCRILTGQVSAEAMKSHIKEYHPFYVQILHAWNVFRLGESWYYADATYGAAAQGRDRYRFFMTPLRNDAVQYTVLYDDEEIFPSKVPGSKGKKTPSEIRAYPVNLPLAGNCGEGSWALDPGTGVLTLSAPDPSLKAGHWSRYEDLITVIKAGGPYLCGACFLHSALPLHDAADETDAVSAARAKHIPCHISSLTDTAPTCATEGRLGRRICEACGVVFDEGTPVPRTQTHTYGENGFCEVCGIAQACLASGICGEDIRWYITPEGELVLTGAGAMQDYELSEDAPWADDERIGSFTVQEGVTSIGKHAFYGCTAKTGSLPGSLVSVGDYAFEGSSLTYLALPDSVEEIGWGLFSNCKALNTVKLPEGIRSVTPYMFSGSGITELRLPPSVYSVGPFAFPGCASLKKITFPDALGLIDIYAFRGTNYPLAELPKTVKSLNPIYYPNTSNYHLRSVSFEDGIEYIPDDICSGKRELQTVRFPDSVTGIGQSAFQETPLTGISLPPMLRSIGKKAFFGSQLNTLFLPETVEEIGESAFGNNTELSAVFIAGTATKLSENTFRGCADSLAIHCPAGSEAALFAAEHGIPCHTTEYLTQNVSAALCSGEIAENCVYCSLCDACFSEKGPVDENGHTPVFYAGTTPSCTQDGTTRGVHCAICGMVFTASDPIAATGHIDADPLPDGICDLCGAALTESQPKPLSSVYYQTPHFEGLLKAIINLIKLISRMFG